MSGVDSTVHKLVLGTLKDLRRVFAARLKEERKRFPKTRLPCDTCAFRTSTDDWPGFESTFLNFVHALAGESIFWCHDDLPRTEDGWQPKTKIVDGIAVVDVRGMTPCAAWFVFQSNPPFHLTDVMPPELIDALVALAGATTICEIDERAGVPA